MLGSVTKYLHTKIINLSIGRNSPLLSIIPTLSPSPSKAIPTSACKVFTFSFKILKFSSTAGSGWWLGKLESLVLNRGINSNLSLKVLKISSATMEVVPFPQS